MLTKLYTWVSAAPGWIFFFLNPLRKRRLPRPRPFLSRRPALSHSLLDLPSSSLSLSLLMDETDKHIHLACMLHAKSLQSGLTV